MTKLISTNPASGYAPIGEVIVSTKQEVTEKVARAQAARKTWKELGVEGRVRLLVPVRDELRNRNEPLLRNRIPEGLASQS